MRLFYIASTIIVIFISNSSPSEDRPILSVDETIGLIFMSAKSYNWNLRARSNPDAKKYVYQVLFDESYKDYHPNCYIILGYIGDDSDVDKLSEQGLHKYEGPRNKYYDLTMHSYFTALAIMSRRQILKADTVIESMLNIRYWDELKIIGSRSKVSNQCIMLCSFLNIYGISGKKDIKEKIKSVKRNFIDAAEIEYFNAVVKPDEIIASSKFLIMDEKEPVTKTQHNDLLGLFEKYGKDVKNSISEGEKDEIKIIIEEAIEEFDKKCDILENRKINLLSSQLLDNGRKLDLSNMTSLVELNKVLMYERDILKELKKSGISYTNIKVDIKNSYDVFDYNTEDKSEYVLVKQGYIIVELEIINSSGVGKDKFDDLKGSLTITKDGSLIVYMKKMDGKWYWNPFGW